MPDTGVTELPKSFSPPADANIPNIESLTPQIQERYDGLTQGIGKNGKSMDPSAFETELNSLSDETRVQLPQTEQQKIHIIDQSLQSGALQPKDILRNLKEHAMRLDSGLSDQDRTIATEGIDSLFGEVSKPETERSPTKMMEGAKKVLGAFKYIGILVLALLSLGIFRGLKAERSR